MGFLPDYREVQDEQNSAPKNFDYEVWKEEDLENLPYGYRFFPDENELILYYLGSKILGLELPVDIIREMDDLYRYDPRDIPIDKFKYGMPNEAYFFTDTGICSKGNLQRPTRDNGYWKDIGRDVQIFSGNIIVGFKKILVFYEGEGQRGKKTNWIISEYRINPQILGVQALNDQICNKIERSVVCRIQYMDSSFFHKTEGYQLTNGR